jgi:hypothetical protein
VSDHAAGDRPLYPQQGDVTVTPVAGGSYVIGHIRDARWVPVDYSSSLPEALRKANLASRVERVRVLVSRSGGPFQLFDSNQLWLDEDRMWHLHIEDEICKVPAAAGVYVIRSIHPKCIGETDDLRTRLRYHLSTLERCERSLPGWCEFSFEIVDDPGKRSFFASRLIEWWAPPCNQFA